MDCITQFYRDHVLFVHAHESTRAPGRYSSRFIVLKDGINLVDVTVDVDFRDAASAIASAIQIARECVDEMLTA